MFLGALLRLNIESTMSAEEEGEQGKAKGQERLTRKANQYLRRRWQLVDTTVHFLIWIAHSSL